jgi:ATP-binding cassette subfamily F protein 3
VLQNALLEYEGTLCLVSHDREFVAPLADRLIEMTGDSALALVENYEEYLTRKTREAREQIRPRRTENTAAPKPVEKPRSERPSNNQIQNWKKELARMESRIDELETKLAALNTELADGSLASDPKRLRERIEDQTEAQLELDTCLARWEELGTLLSSVPPSG